MKLIFVLVIAAGFVFYFDVAAQLQSISERNSDAVFYSLIIACVCYGLLLMLPFVPALELGLLLMSIYGADGIIGAYVATVSALMLSFFVGCKLGQHRKIHWSANESKTQTSRQKQIRNRLLMGFYKNVSRRPYMSLALLLNMPGNVVLGGAGGIAMMAGASGHMQFFRYGLTVMLATSVLPILFMVGISL